MINMITSGQMRAARALLGIDQRELAKRCGLSLPTIQRMEASDGVVRGNVNSLMKLVDALAANGIELIGEGATSSAGRARGAAQMTVAYLLYGVAALLVLAPIAVALADRPAPAASFTAPALVVTLVLGVIALIESDRQHNLHGDVAARPALAGRAFPSSMR